MAEVSTLVDTSTTDLGALTSEVRSLSVEFGQAPVATAKALYTTISAGFSEAADATTLLTGAMKLARGGLAPLETSIDGLTSILNSYGLAASQVTKVSDLMFTAMKAGKTTIGALSESMGRVTPLAASAGVGLDELLASVSALTLGGLGTAEAVTSMRGIISALLKPTAEATELAGKLGLQFNAGAVQAKGFASWLAEVAAKTHGDQTALATLFGQVEGLTGALALTGNQAASFAAILGQMQTASGATEEAFRKVDATAGAAFGRMSASVSVLMSTIGEALLPTVTLLANAVGRAAGAFATFAEAHPLLTKVLVTVAAVTAGVLLLGGAGLIMAGQIMLAMAMVNVSTGGVLLAVGAVIAGVSALALLLTSASEDMAESSGLLARSWGWVKDAFYAMAVPVAFGVGFLAGTITNAWRNVAAYTEDVWPLIQEVVSGVWLALKPFVFAHLAPIVAPIVALVTTGWGIIRTATVFTWDVFAAVVKGAFVIVTNTIAFYWHVLSGLFKAGLQVLTGDWSGAWATLKTSGLKALGDLKGVFSDGFVDLFGGITKAWLNAGKGLASALLEGVRAGWKTFTSGFEDLLAGIRILLPGSDAKAGPLSDLTASGRALPRTFALGLRQESDAPQAALEQSLSPLKSMFEPTILQPELLPAAARLDVALPSLDLAAPPASTQRNEDHSRTLVIERGAIQIHAENKSVGIELEKQLEELLAKLNRQWGPSYA